MAASSTDLFTYVAYGTLTHLAAPGYTIGASSINADDLSAWPTATGVYFGMDTIDATGTRIDGSYTAWKAIVSGNTLGSLTLKYGTDQNYAAGTSTRLFILDTAALWNALIDGLSVEHKKNGKHGIITADALTVTGPTILNGSWDGWIGANEAWSYASSTTITVPTDATTKYDKGDLIKITQSATVKYYVITAVASTILTVSPLTAANTVANSAITANAYSKARNPHGALSGALPYNPYKFSAYRNSAWTTANGSDGLITFDTKSFDTSSNYDTSTGKFTAPIAGFYFFNASYQVSATGVWRYIMLYVNGAEVLRGNSGADAASAIISGATVSGLLQLAASDYVQVYTRTNQADTGQTGAKNTYFHGFLQSAV